MLITAGATMWSRRFALNSGVLRLRLCTASACLEPYSAPPRVGCDRLTFARVLDGVRSRQDVDHFLSQFGSEKHNFSVRRAVIKVGGSVVENELEELVRATSVLYRIGIQPVLIHGGGDQINRLLAQKGIEPEYRDGMRVTSKETLEIASRVFLENNATLVSALGRAGLPAVACTKDTVYAEYLDMDKWGLVGNPTGANTASLNAHLDRGSIPVIPSLAETRDSPKQILNINADVAACQVAKALQPQHVVFVNTSGGLAGADGAVMESVDLATQYDSLLAQPWVKHGLRLKLNEFHALLSTLDRSAAIAVTSTNTVAPSLLFGRCERGTIVFASRSLGNRRYCSTRTSSPNKLRLGLVGARGYVGHELVRLVQSHPTLELACIGTRSSSSSPGKTLPLALTPMSSTDWSTFPSIDAWVLALPNGEAVQYMSQCPPSASTAVVDLSYDFRHDPAWAYGLVERFRPRLCGAKRIANPGCYATGAQLALWPLVAHQVLDVSRMPSVFGVSGYSGAGTTKSDKNDPNILRDNLLPYALVGHAHEREVSAQLGLPVAFTPHVAPFFRGITLTIHAPLARALSRDELVALYAKQFEGEALVSIVKDDKSLPYVRDAQNRPGAAIGGFAVDKQQKRAVMVVTLDNLLKGAATQALQNVNLALGLDELAGIEI